MAPKSKFPQIRLSELTYEELRRLGEKGESFDDIVRRLITCYSTVSSALDKAKHYPPGEEPTE